MQIFVKGYRKNVLNVIINSPTVILPFKQNSYRLIQQSDSWVFCIKKIEFSSKDEGIEAAFYEGF